ncbi:MAG: hypothetical protein NW214_07445 [Pseudanabaenaceae cyanobacterium bins.39]|nr:hypothetical protein [Pseudanabaenaceae cyanobacterium bins.39]
MPQNQDNFLILKQENLHLQKKNEELEQQIAEIKQATEELAKLRKEAAIESIAGEVRKKVLGGIGLLGIASIAGLLGLYHTAHELVVKELTKPERLDTISNVIVQQLTKPERLDTISNAVTPRVSAELATKFSGDQVFKNTIIDVIATKLPANDDFMNKLIDSLLKNPYMTVRIESIAASQSDIGLKELASSSKDKKLSESINANLSSKRYYVIAASSTQETELKALVKNNAKLNNLNPHICPPNKKKGYLRSVLILTNPNTGQGQNKFTFPFGEARQKEKKAQDIEKTAYILDASPSNESNIWFDEKQCKTP